MRVASLAIGATVGALLTAPLIGIMYLADEAVGLPFIPYDLFDWITRVLPGPVVTFGIDLIIDTLRTLGASVSNTAKTAERAIAVIQFFSMGVFASAIFFLVQKVGAVRPGRGVGVVFGALVGLPMIAISISIEGSSVQPLLVILWLGLLFFVWGLAVATVYDRIYRVKVVSGSGDASVGKSGGLDRRQFIIRMGAATALITVASSGIGKIFSEAARRDLESQIMASAAHNTDTSATSAFPNALDPLTPAPGTRPEYTPLKDHYKVFLRSQPTVINGSEWTLPIGGMVKNRVSLTIDDIRNNYEAREEYVTLSCISGRVGTDLISTTYWTGASLQDILADVEPDPEAQYLEITCGDGFYETVDLDLIASDKRIMLCYAWDGNTLPIGHGFPLRIWIPDRFGMKQPKWITGMELKKKYKKGYWVERGWSETAIVKATSVIDTTAVAAAYQSNGQMLVPVGGIAFAGKRKISKVEVRVDNGLWKSAQLRQPLSDTTWVIWRYDWPFSAGSHNFEVRCVEGDGTPQIEEKAGNRPSGATGIHSKRTLA